jgi:hypothetical protein
MKLSVLQAKRELFEKAPPLFWSVDLALLGPGDKIRLPLLVKEELRGCAKTSLELIDLDFLTVFLIEAFGAFRADCAYWADLVSSMSWLLNFYKRYCLVLEDPAPTFSPAITKRLNPVCFFYWMVPPYSIPLSPFLKKESSSPLGSSIAKLLLNSCDLNFFESGSMLPLCLSRLASRILLPFYGFWPGVSVWSEENV